MLKTLLYYFLVVVTTLRLTGVVYLLASGETNLPTAVLAAVAAVLFYSTILICKRLFGGNVTVRQFMAFHIVRAATVVFNLTFTSLTSPLLVTGLEVFAIGTFLDVLIDLCIVYFCQRHIRSHYLEVARDAALTTRAAVDARQNARKNKTERKQD